MMKNPLVVKVKFHNVLQNIRNFFNVVLVILKISIEDSE